MTDLWKAVREEGMQEGLQKGLQEGLQKGLQEGLQKGLQQGRQEGKRELVEQMLRRGVSVTDIVKLTGMPEEEVEAIRREALQ
ncbi:RpnC/YadD family protein [Kyrpidia tusciae]|uniref:hypothetical protein n=1 Tax=Kyrpidia tusciae TaxID=33943 RepID=UPI00030757A2|nr:hypothetical protein [Kyrpidia tusciae]